MSTTHSTDTTSTSHSHSATHARASAHRAEDTEAKSEIPVLNIGKLLERFKLPGIDLPALAEAQRKNVEALQHANQKAYAGVIALAQRQAEIFQQTMTQWQEAAKELNAKSPAESVAKQADLAKKAIENALAHMRELAEMAATSQREAYEVIRKRVQTGMQEFRDYLNKKS
jgi:phasin family protein